MLSSSVEVERELHASPAVLEVSTPAVYRVGGGGLWKPSSKLGERGTLARSCLELSAGTLLRGKRKAQKPELASVLHR